MSRLCLLSGLLLCCVFDSNFLMIDALVGLDACRPDQIQAIMEFKNEFDSRGCNQSDYVNGVRCNNATGAVKKLQLPRGCLSGVLKPNSSLFRLHHLRYLSLSNNDFTSSLLHSGFGNLNKLEVLSLSYNGFVGQVPSSFSNLSHLSYLDLSYNKLIGSCPLVQNLTKLSVLALSTNLFTGTIPSSLLTLPFLSVLVLNRNHFTGSIEVPNSSFSSRLDTLLLGDNQFEGHILEPISKFINIKKLGIASLNTSFPIDLKQFSSLKSLLFLDISDNSISPASLSSDSYLSLSLEYFLLSGCEIREFPKILKTLQELIFLDMANNRIKGKIPEWLWTLPRLKVADLAFNLFNGFEGSTKVLVNSSVTLLILNSNCFKGAIPVLPLSIRVLLLRHNEFTGSIPLSICTQSSLVVLDLSYNNFTGSIPQCINNLGVVKLRKNNLEGSLPDMFYTGASLRILDVGYNRLTGKLPRSLVNCSVLRFLNVDNNRIEDTFPFWLKASRYLQVLTLSSNRFYGHISPPDQGPLGFPELIILEISDNNFTGSLPASYFMNWKAPSLKLNEFGRSYMIGYTIGLYDGEDTIDLRYKGLHMEQERFLKFYTAIDFSGNRIEGQIPESIGLLKTLIALNLSNNVFTCHIPPSLANLKELQSLDLSRNQLAGTIPKELEDLSFLGFINMSQNQLKGEIPQGAQFIGQPKSSFEGNAGLCGLPLEGSCFGTNAKPTQQPKEEDEEEEEEVLNWKGVVIGYGTGVLLGLAIAQVIASYKPEWLAKIICLNKSKNR